MSKQECQLHGGEIIRGRITIWTNLFWEATTYLQTARRLLIKPTRLGLVAILLAGLLGSVSASVGLGAPNDWLLTTREQHTATLLPDSNVLIVGGLSNGDYLESTELYNPVTGDWMATGTACTTK